MTPTPRRSFDLPLSPGILPRSGVIKLGIFTLTRTGRWRTMQAVSGVRKEIPACLCCHKRAINFEEVVYASVQPTFRASCDFDRLGRRNYFASAGRQQCEPEGQLQLFD